MKKSSKKTITGDFISKYENIFSCPICAGQMWMVNLKSLICTNNHCYDVSKHGYVNFLSHTVKTKYDKQM
ncbi:MAG: putative RNA methyltransferase [Bacillota bacterium]